VQDLAYVLGTIVFVVIGALFIAGCDKIIGPDDVALLEDLPAGEPEPDDEELPIGEVAA
jgi:hypothetical protein